MATLLVVDDEPNVLYSLKKGLESPEIEVVTAETADEGIRAVREHAPDAVILDVKLPDMSGLDAFNEIHRIDARLPIILVTAYSTTETAIEAMKRGAFDYLLKPVEFDVLQDTVDRALQVSRMSRVPAAIPTNDETIPTLDNADRIVGRSPKMQEVYKLIGRVAPQDVTVLILGESGTGKEMVARAIYQHSRRAAGPFLAINCAAIPETLLESELFGHERGAFTGADRRRIGKFEQVNGGTIFLDEIGDMSSATQAKVLRLLQEGTFERVGSNETIQVNVRVVAATNKNLERAVAEHQFRQDLFYRLKVFTIELPPLRERLDDLPLLIEHFLRVYNQELGKSVHRVAPGVLEMLRGHHWPGNIRELQSAIKYALVRTPGDVLTCDSFPMITTAAGESPIERTPAPPIAPPPFEAYVRNLLRSGEPELYRRVHADVDRILITEVLNSVGGNQAQASEILGISRGTLRTRISDLNLLLEKRIRSDDPLTK